MKLRLSDTQVIVLLVTALIFQILLLLWHMELIGVHSSSDTPQDGVLAGSIENIENTLKRRPLDSLIWEQSRAPEKVFYHDSILTLSESSAKIKLKNGTQINLAENTLITIEPDESSTTGEIRIQFSQGNLKARNPYQKTTIENQNLAVTIDPNSDVDISKNESGEFEIFLNKGQALVRHNDENINLKGNEVLQLTQAGVSRSQVSQTLKWVDSSLLRSYTHFANGQFNLKWTGGADQLIVNQMGQPFLQKKLSASSQSVEIELPLGSYRAYLVKDSSRTLYRDLQVWKAPLVQLVLPRPRDRYSLGEVRFVWTPNKKIKSYEVNLLGEKNDLRFPANLNKLTESIKVEDNFNWGVWGIDQNGFKIPPKYRYPLFIRANPFAPPKIKKKPDKFKPKTSLLDFLLFGQAWAQTKKQAILSWEKIAGAEIYIVEISETENFRKPLVQTQIEGNEFIWPKKPTNKTFYWRVAAGDRSGRLGIFSQPSLVEWVAVKKPTALLKPKKIVAKKTPPKGVSGKKPAPPVQPKKQEPRKPLFAGGALYYLPSYGLKSYQENGLTKANLDGLNPLGLGFKLDFNITNQSQIKLYTKFSQVEYEPEPKDEFPFQDNLQTHTLVNQISWTQNDSRWGFGVVLADLPIVEKDGFESVLVQQKWSYGFLVQRTFELDRVTINSALSIQSLESQWGGHTSHQFLSSTWFPALVFGCELEAFYFTGDDSSSLIADFYLIFGVEF